MARRLLLFTMATMPESLQLEDPVYTVNTISESGRNRKSVGAFDTYTRA